jgi:hypothetical protein
MMGFFDVLPKRREKVRGLVRGYNLSRVSAPKRIWTLEVPMAVNPRGGTVRDTDCSSADSAFRWLRGDERRLD